MGINDHRKHWFIELAANEDECEEAFRRAFDKGEGRIGRKGKFVVESGTREEGREITARYLGRGGMAAVVGGLSESSYQLGQNAKGSGVSMVVEPSERTPDKLVCQVWLSNWSSALGSFGTADVGILRAYVQEVRDRIARLDSSARIWSEK